eukprot:COSAG04_NODE_15946_length_515_cov_0.480769_1_plen_151_part_01
MRRDLCDRPYNHGFYSCSVEGVTAVPASVGAFGSLASLALPAGVSVLPASGCAGVPGIASFAYGCWADGHWSTLEAGEPLGVTTDAAEVAALLDFCSANPGMSRYSTPICGSGSMSANVTGVQWGNGDPCAGNGWYGVTCDAAGERVTAMC